MSETTVTPLPDPSIADRRLRSNLPKGGFTSDPFTDVLRDGARKLIEQAIHAELAALMNAFSGERLEDGRARPVRHGHLPEREVMTGIGPVPVKVPRVRDRGAGEDTITFTPSILPRYLRKAKSVEELLPWHSPLCLNQWRTKAHSQGRVDRRFHRGTGGPARPECQGVVGQDRHAAEGRLVDRP